eukprot:gene601-1262_t
MNSRTCWMLVVLLAIFVDDGMAWRRRRRRAPPPPPPNCGVSAWSSWSTCSQFCSVGTQSRTRYITYRPSASCIQPSLTESRQCGVSHGGCAHNCDNTNHVCTCRSGYNLMSDGKGCQDVNECSPNGGKGPCSHTCTNSAGSFACSCPHRYNLHSDAKTCLRAANNPPSHIKFEQYKLYENATAGFYVGRLVAVDKDGDVMSFSMSQTTSTASEVFTLGSILCRNVPTASNPLQSECGTHVILMRPLNYESKSSYVLKVTATDPMGGFVTKEFTIVILDLNESPTDILLSCQGVADNSTADTIVAQITVVDPDIFHGSPQQHTCTVSPSSPFIISGLNLVVARNAALDFEQKSLYVISITCTDAGIPPLSLSKVFNIRVRAPTSPSTNIKGVCPEGLTGSNCERYSNICNSNTCGTFQVCVSHVEWVLKCISPSNQIPVLLRQSYMTVSVPENQYKIEAYVESILEGTRPAGQTLSSIFSNNVINKRHCYLPPKNFYAEIVTSRSVSTYTHVIFVIMNPKSKYTAFPRTNICQMLTGTDVRCVTEADCKLLERHGINCLFKFDGGGSGSGRGKNKGMSWESYLGMGSAIAFALFISGLFYCKCKCKCNSQVGVL